MTGPGDPIGSVHVLPRQRNGAEALHLLRRVAAQVRPVMRARGWRVGVLREFLPCNARLLGVNINGGQEIRLRLRPAHDPSAFLPYGDLLGTMLHELAHIARGPHDRVFYATLDALRQETQRLVDAGYRGDGFFSQGRCVGGHVAHTAGTPAEARARALAAVERRAGGRALGGSPRTLDPPGAWRAMAARAAERRLRDDRWCGAAKRGDAGGVIVISDCESEHDQPSAVIVLSDSDDGP
ncbi:hypothetical protein GGI15_003159 [Coemansia interrupta]|uniref:WLM domain-containing protein n=1 Tax=Coemansia interrupta TaxID=1126814 RepID=A0A9W8HFU5_9FUNG|nr:hypothetical protein GGI15_003159 [Coemansia interrupta]